MISIFSPFTVTSHGRWVSLKYEASWSKMVHLHAKESWRQVKILRKPLILSNLYFWSLCPQLRRSWGGWAYWFGPDRGCVCASVTLAYGQEQLEIGSWNLICGLIMKYKWTRIFSFPSDLSLQSYVPFSTVFDFPIVSLWNFVNKISREPFELGSSYSAHRLCPWCRRPD